MRNHVDAGEPDAGRLDAELVEGGSHRGDDEVLLVERHLVAADTVHLDDQAALGDLGLQPVAEVEREPEGVEAGAEVGRGGRDGHPHRLGGEPHSPAASATAATSGTTTSSTTVPPLSVKPSSAVTVSLSP